MKAKKNLLCVALDNISPIWIDLNVLVEKHDSSIKSYLLSIGYSSEFAALAELRASIVDSEGEVATYFANKNQDAKAFFHPNSKALRVITDYCQNLYSEDGFNIAIWIYCVETTDNHEEAMYKALNIQIISDMDEYIDNTVLMNFRENEDVYRYFDREAYLRDCILNGEYKDMGDDLYIVC